MIVVTTLTLVHDQGKGLQDYGPRGKPRSEGKWEGMNPHTSKGASTLGIGVQVDSKMFREQLQGSKPNGSKSSLYH
jgi:hypothetical protein